MQSLSLSVTFFTEPEVSKIYMEKQKATNGQSNSEKEKWSWRNQTP